jgi:hypothetical protein
MLNASFEWNLICYPHGWENVHPGVELLMLAIIFAAGVLYAFGLDHWKAFNPHGTFV